MYLWTLIADQMICTARNCLGPGPNANISTIHIHADVWDVISCEKRGIVFFRFLVMFNQFHQPSFIQPSMVKICNRIKFIRDNSHDNPVKFDKDINIFLKNTKTHKYINRAECRCMGCDW